MAKHKFGFRIGVFGTKASRERLSAFVSRYGAGVVLDAFEFWAHRDLEWILTYCQHPDSAFMANIDTVICEMQEGEQSRRQPSPSSSGSRPPEAAEFPDIRPLTDEQKRKIIEATPNPFAAKKKEPPVDMAAAARAQLRALKEKDGEGTKE